MFFDLSLAFKLAIRELRDGLGGFYVLIGCIIMGVTAITTVGVLSQALSDGLANQGRELLGGDLSFSLTHRQVNEEQRRFISSYGRISETATLRSIARVPASGQNVLVDIKAVDEAYPLVGDLVLKEGVDLAKNLGAEMTAVVAPLLLTRLNIKVGDSFSIGKARITVTGTIANEPDRLSGRINFGPRVLMTRKTLIKTGLVQPGSLINWRIKLALNDNERNVSPSTLQTIRNEVIQQFPNSAFSIRDRLNPSPGLNRAIGRFSQFLTLVSLSALFIGGIGIANAVSSHISRKKQVIATFKSLGASTRLVFLTFAIEILILAGCGIAMGLIAGLAVPQLINQIYMGALPVQLVFGVPFKPIFLASLYGFLVAFIFMLWPLGEAKRIRAAELYRAEISSPKQKPDWRIVTIIILLIAALITVTTVTSSEQLITVYALVFFILLYFAFFGLAALLHRGFKFLPRQGKAEWALARASLARPGQVLRTVILSLGIGLSLLTTVSFIERSLVAELKTGLPEEAPNFFVLDIDKSQIEDFRSIASKNIPNIKFNVAPMLRGRLINVAGVQSDQLKPAPDVEWVLRGDRGLTFNKEIPQNSKLVAGNWWREDYDGPPLVSFEERVAKGLGLKLGDKVTVNILGRDIEATVANFREVVWQSLSLNFTMIFTPNTLQEAPYKLLATLSLPPESKTEAEGKLLSELVSNFPAITPISVKEVLIAVDSVVQQLLMAVRMSNIVLLLTGALALAGALAASHRQRIHETVIFKVLGATRKRILLAHLIEYLILTIISASIALIFGGLLSYVLVTKVMKLNYIFSGLAMLEIFAIVSLLVMPIGLLGTWRILGQKSTSYLRQR